jgi:hypothetical protein
VTIGFAAMTAERGRIAKAMACPLLFRPVALWLKKLI